MASTIAASVPVAAARVVAGRRAQAPRAALSGARLAKKETTFSGKVAERVAAVKVRKLGPMHECAATREAHCGLPPRHRAIGNVSSSSCRRDGPLLQVTRPARTVATMAKKSGGCSP